MSDLGSIPDVEKHMVPIEAVAGEEWWQDVTLPMLEQVRAFLRAHASHITWHKLRRNQTLTANQPEFVNLIVTHLTERGVRDRIRATALAA